VKAWQVNKIGAPEDVMELTEVDAPVVTPGTLHIRVLVAGVSLPEVLMCHDTYEFKPARPFTPGHEAVGIVLDAGDSSVFKPGQRVMGVTFFLGGRGGHAEETLLFESSTTLVPEAMSDEHAAAFTIGFQTAYLSLVTRGALRDGETVLVHGAAGGTGAPAVQLAKALGARVIAVARGAEKVEACRLDGADVVIDSSLCADGDWAPAVKEAAGEAGVNVVFDPVGGDTFVRSLDSLAYGARLLAIGFASGSWGEVPTADLVRRNLSLVGALAMAPSEEESRRMGQVLTRLYAEGKLVPRVTDVYAFEDIPKALTELDQRRAFGKQVVRVSHAASDD
jgi:NADPH2:quinone reductase